LYKKDIRLNIFRKALISKEIIGFPDEMAVKVYKTNVLCRCLANPEISKVTLKITQLIDK